MAVQLERDISRTCHLGSMTYESEPGDICTSVDLHALHGLPCIPVQECHRCFHLSILFISQEVYLGCCSQNTCSDLLGYDQQIPLTCAVAEDIIRMCKTGHRQSVLRLLVVDAVPADDRCTRFIDLVISALEDSFDHIKRQLIIRECQQVHGELRLSAHSIDIAERVCSSYLSEHVRIVNYRREEVHRVDQCNIIRHLVHARIVAAFKSHKDPRVADLRQTRKYI